MSANSPQLDLFKEVTNAYLGAVGGILDNKALYAVVAEKAGIPISDFDKRVPIGETGALHSPMKRKTRWVQQDLVSAGFLEKVENARGFWRLTEAAGKNLHKAAAGVKLVAFSTDLGMAIWGNNRDVFTSLSEPLHLIITSPPYPLRAARAYGNPIGDYNDFICSSLEPLLRNLVQGGSIVLNVGDVFEEKSPAKSMYVERLILALHDRLSLSLMNRVIWHNPTKPPGPTYWACVNRVQLCGSYEHLLWMTNDPQRVRSDNRRVLEEHSESHKKLMAKGGEQRQAVYGDGAYRIRPDSFGAVTVGRIPKDILTKSHNCPDTRAYRKFASELGLPVHGAMQPTSIPDFFIRLLTQPDELVADLFAGTARAGLAAERLGRRWIMSEQIVQFLRPAAEMFRSFPGFSIHPAIEQFVAPQSI